MANWDAADAVAALDALLIRTRNATRDATAKGAQVMVAYAMQFAPVRAGTLRRSIFADPVTQLSADTWMTEVAPHVIYARIQDLGGTIYPVRARALSWLGDDGLRHFARSVTIKGTFYMERAVAAAAPRIAQIAYQAWADAFSGS